MQQALSTAKNYQIYKSGGCHMALVYPCGRHCPVTKKLQPWALEFLVLKFTAQLWSKETNQQTSLRLPSFT